MVVTWLKTGLFQFLQVCLLWWPVPMGQPSLYQQHTSWKYPDISCCALCWCHPQQSPKDVQPFGHGYHQPKDLLAAPAGNSGPSCCKYMEDPQGCHHSKVIVSIDQLLNLIIVLVSVYNMYWSVDFWLQLGFWCFEITVQCWFGINSRKSKIITVKLGEKQCIQIVSFLI